MAPQYHTLQTIYDIVKNDPQPTTYPCNTRDIILRQVAGWGSIEKLDRVVVCITPTGIETAESLVQRQHMGQS